MKFKLIIDDKYLRFSLAMMIIIAFFCHPTLYSNGSIQSRSSEIVLGNTHITWLGVISIVLFICSWKLFKKQKVLEEKNGVIKFICFILLFQLVVSALNCVYYISYKAESGVKALQVVNSELILQGEEGENAYLNLEFEIKNHDNKDQNFQVIILPHSKTYNLEKREFHSEKPYKIKANENKRISLEWNAGIYQGGMGSLTSILSQYDIILYDNNKCIFYEHR